MRRTPVPDRSWLAMEDDHDDDHERTPLKQPRHHQQTSSSRYRNDADGRLDPSADFGSRAKTRQQQPQGDAAAAANTNSSFHQPFATISNFLTSQTGESFRSRAKDVDRTHNDNESDDYGIRKKSLRPMHNSAIMNHAVFSHSAFAAEDSNKMETTGKQSKYEEARAAFLRPASRNEAPPPPPPHPPTSKREPYRRESIEVEKEQLPRQDSSYGHKLRSSYLYQHRPESPSNEQQPVPQPSKPFTQLQMPGRFQSARAVEPSAPDESLLVDVSPPDVLPVISMLTPNTIDQPHIFESLSNESSAEESAYDYGHPVESPASEGLSSLGLNTLSLAPKWSAPSENAAPSPNSVGARSENIEYKEESVATMENENEIEQTYRYEPRASMNTASTAPRWDLESVENATGQGTATSPEEFIPKPFQAYVQRKPAVAFQTLKSQTEPKKFSTGRTVGYTNYEASPASTHLQGLAIHSPADASGITSSIPSPRESVDSGPIRRVSFDVDNSRCPVPEDVENQISFGEPSVIHEESSNFDAEASVSQSRTSTVIARSAFRVWGELLNGQILRAANLTTDELCNVKKVISNAIIRSLGLSDAMENWNDFDYLYECHQNKMVDLFPPPSEEHFEFALVLTPQEVYGFWAELLDFRAEHLGMDFVASATPKEDGAMNTFSDEDDFKENSLVETIDSRPIMTPSTGLRNRGKDITPTPHTAPQSSTRTNFSAGMLTVDTSRLASTRRQSLFERAFDVFSPSRSQRCLAEGETTPTPSKRETKWPTPSMNSATRRRWGNRVLPGATPDVMSPPVRSLKKQSSVKKRRALSTVQKNLMSPSEMTCNTQGEQIKRHPNAIRIEDIPNQVVPRGIAVRTKGLEKFLSALKRGIVVRRHRPHGEAVLCKLVSNDGGDTVHFEPVETEEATLAFKEQRIRYNPSLAKNGSPDIVRSRSLKWTHSEEMTEVQNHHFSLPDHVAAERYRQQQNEKRSRVSKKMADIATKVAQRGTIRASEMIEVHPGSKDDPRSERSDLCGTASLRKSKSDFHAPFSFSVICTSATWINGQTDTKTANEKWNSGKLSDVQFKTFDFEAATEGEYWLIFRGFLLLQRDAYHGRFAKHRSAGFGNNIRREKSQNDDDEEDCPGFRLNKEAYLEPHTLGLLEKMVSKVRKTDDEVYITGRVEPGAIPPPSDYFLGFRSPGTEIWSRLRQAGLETQRIYNLDTRQVMIKVFCPADRIMDVAEVLRLKLKTRDGSFAPFREDSIDLFPKVGDAYDPSSPFSRGASVLRSSQRQLIADFIIRSRIRDSGAELGQNTDLGKKVAARVPLHAREKLDGIYNAWVYFWRRSNWCGRDGRSMSVDVVKNFRESKVDESYRSLFQPVQGSLDEIDESPSQLLASDDKVPNFYYRLIFGSFHQPLDTIEEYFGEKIAFYFAWLQHCSYHLIFLSCAGLFVFILMMASGNWDHPIRPFFSNVVMVWSFVVLVQWRQRSNCLAHRWGTMDLKEQETTRPQFKGEYRQDEITGEWIIFYPKWKRWLKYLISVSLTLAFTIGTLIVILIVHSNRDLLLARYFEQKLNPGSEAFRYDLSVSAIGKRAPLNAVVINQETIWDPTFWIIVAGYPSALGLCLPLLNLVLMRISVMLNNFENYRTETEYRTNLIIKVFSFRFVCYFATLYYYAYVSIGTQQEIENGILRVGSGVAIYMTVAHWWSIFLSVYFPMLLFRLRSFFKRVKLVDELRKLELEEFVLSNSPESNEEIEKTRKKLVNKRILLEQAQDNIWDEVVLREHDSFPEYIQAVVQFAYVTCFSVVLPIAPIICLINHLLSIRLDAYKLCKGRRRPLAQKTGGIGVWEHVLHIVTVIAVLTNCFLMGFASTQFQNISDTVGNLGLFCIIVGWEHIMLLIKYIMSSSVSKLPKSVRDEMKREQHELTKLRNSDMMRKKSRRSKRQKEHGDKGSVVGDDESLATYRSDAASEISSFVEYGHARGSSRPPVRESQRNLNCTPKSLLRPMELQNRLNGEYGEGELNDRLLRPVPNYDICTVNEDGSTVNGDDSSVEPYLYSA